MKILASIALLFFTFVSLGQEDTSKFQNLKSIYISSPFIILYIPHPIVSQTLQRKDIQELQPEDMGLLIQKFAGVSMKSYGGLGGMKTFSFRSMGSQHTAVVMDGFSVQNPQSGQLNLGQIHTSNIESVTLGKQATRVGTPVSALNRANEMSLSTFEGHTVFNKKQIRSSVKGGSFGQSDNYLGYHFAKKKFGFTVHGKYRQAKGDYPFIMKVGDFEYQGVQNNNELQELYSGVSFFYRPNEMKKPIRFMYRNTFVDQGLPGAVILYNNSKGQFLNTQKHNLAADWTHKWGFINVRYYASYQYDEQHYLDSNYFNSVGFLKRDFYQNSGQLGWRFERQKFGDLFNFYGGIEQQYASLKFGGLTETLPQRHTTHTNLGFRINEKKYNVDMRIGYQLVAESKNEGEVFKLRHLWAPILNFETAERGKSRWKSGFSTSTTVRLPSFNELYYAQVGNPDLEPEKVRQFNLFTGIARDHGSWLFASKVVTYYNQIENKILAIPTKNLFVWSIQNIDKVNALGIDAGQVIKKRFNTKWNTELQLNYSFQYSVDVTDENSPTYAHQIAYIPYHTANADWSLSRNKTNFRVSSSFIGGRYSLNENVSNNYLDPFIVLDASISHGIEVKYNHKINFQFQVKNIIGQNYTYIRSFVMPGRNFLISLNYEL